MKLDIPDKTIIICEDSYKKNILEKSSKSFLNLKFYSKSAFFKEYLFDYDQKALLYLRKKYNLKIDVIQVYLDNLYFIKEQDDYKNPKLTFLKKIKEDLLDNNLLKFNPNFEHFLKNYNILVIGYPYLYNYELEIFKKINVQIINENKENYSIEKVYEFATIEEEINYVFKCISKLLLKGVNINNIKIANVSQHYYSLLKRFSLFYNIPLNIPTNNNLYNNIVGKTFLNNFNGNFNDALESIKDFPEEILKKIITICNKYIDLEDDKGIKDLLASVFKRTKIDNFNLKNYIEIMSITDDFKEDDYIFLMNFNAPDIPKYKKDEAFITDNIATILKEKNVFKINEEIKNYTINKIKGFKNLVITYKLNSKEGECLESSLIKEMNLSISRPRSNKLISYSSMYDKIRYAKMLDNYLFYGDIDSNLSLYANNLSISYNSYNNEYTPIAENSLKEYLGNKLILSYSSLNNYNKCAFRYYLANILKIDKYNDSLEIFIGSMFHDVLEKCLHGNLKVEEEINNYILSGDKIFSAKEKFFIKKITNDIILTLDVLKEQKAYTDFDNALYEQKINIDKSKDIPVTFMGFIDKILYKEEKYRTLVAIIDYKTGKPDINLQNSLYGLSLQLPIYLYLIKKSNLFKNPTVVGFYLEYILNNDITILENKSYMDIFKDNLKLVGYSTTNLRDLKCFDKTYKNSKLIKGLKVKENNEFYKSAKVLSNIEMDNLTSLVEKNIDADIAKILHADFEINPKKIGYKKDIGCEYCHFKDICFKKESDYVILNDNKNLDFLGGVNDAKMD